MEWDFSCVDSSDSNVKQHLFEHINNCIQTFASYYKDILPEKIVIDPDQAMTSFNISERQSRSGFADLAMIVRPDCRKYQLIDTLVEFKLIRSKEIKQKNIKKLSDTALFKSDLVKAKLNEAKSQAKTYSNELINEFGYQVKLQTFAVISIGFDRLLYKKI